MKRICILLSMLPVGLMAQNYTEIQTGMRNFYYGSADVADMDNDGKQDVVINGAIDSDGDGNVDTSFNEVYKNNGTSLVPYANLGANATHLGDIKFMDFDNDGLMDIISTGLSYNDIVNYKHYRFKNTGTGFVKAADLAGKIYGSLEAFDFDNDGKVDYAINGTQYVEGTGFVNNLDFYRNTATDFELTKGWHPGTQNGSFKFVDLNNDNFLDLVILGVADGDNPIFKVFMNQSGTLTLSQDFTALTSGKMEYADFNADGFQDIVITGQDTSYEGFLAVLMNDGTGHLNLQKISVPEIADSSVTTGDVNNDGYYDFIVSGNDSNNDAVVKTFLYNPSNQNFTENIPTGLHMLGGPGFVNLLDFDNDHHLDVLLAGFDWADPGMPSLTKFFKNTSTEVNLKPVPPAVLNVVKTGNRFKFSWSGASDDKTPTNALRYEIKVGSTPGAANLAKYVVTTPSWFLDLDPYVQNVYWSVRSIDASKIFSDASTQSTLGTRDVAVSSQISIYPNPTSEKVFIKGEKVSEVEMYSMDGRKQNVVLNNDQSINVSHLTKGVYLLKLKIKNEVTTQKLIIQ
ncbi:Por secretion system C-terminal sorting domain-containing protein [Chryseobacterium oleae]|uniref:Por secretion system C-terminal sorting domain-containing protein n=1 Tax=Chryseobacterium oleae TaxID=491207 RepID=A0A1I4WLS3_CHROL|nr:T9SS type A sorting domain-containing protein [Chryseobacterium oleae]SFN14834.1 Por secretion system C-terminal sorting domain-containing protein [Chryseobacterium oleae]